MNFIDIKEKRREHLKRKYHLEGYYDESPQLINAVLSGTNFTRANSIKYYNRKIEKDIIDIIKLIPDSLKCGTDVMRCRWYMTALHLACFNNNISIKIIKYMILHGADITQTYSLMGQQIDILTDLKNSGLDIDKYKLNEITKLFTLETCLKFKLKNGPLYYYPKTENFTDLNIAKEYKIFLHRLNINEVNKHIVEKFVNK